MKENEDINKKFSEMTWDELCNVDASKLSLEEFEAFTDAFDAKQKKFFETMSY